MDTSKPSEKKTHLYNKAPIPPSQRRYRWVMLSLLCLLYVAFGLIARAVSPLVTPIVRDLRLSYTQMGFILGSWQLTYIVVSIIAGTMVDRWGVRKTLLGWNSGDWSFVGATVFPKRFRWNVGGCFLIWRGRFYDLDRWP